MNKITVLFPGGFKPLTGAHLDLANRYATDSNVDRVILLIGPKERDGITREKTIDLFNILNDNPKIIIQPTEFNSPIMAAYEYLFALPEDATGRYAMAASAKGDDYVRAKDFVPNVDKYATIGDKKGRTIPKGIDAVELSVNVDPLMYPNQQPVSATVVRQSLADDDYGTFRMSYPQYNEAKVKNAWQILKNMAESAFTREWWQNELQQDIDAVIEGMMFPDEKKRHSDKIKKLRSFLDSNTGKSFVYDFDKFNKTVFGAKLQESVISENYITREELQSIERAVDGFFAEYGIDVNFQGQFTHFIERLNDPRNEAPIYTDELRDFFEDLSNEYGERIATQLHRNLPTGVGSDYQFDIPIHMPFMLRWNSKKNIIELIPRTIKKQRKRWVSNNPTDVVYTIESSMGKNALITDGVVCEICGEEMRQITPNHLKYKHQITLAEYKIQYPNSKTISDSLRISLSENNPMYDKVVIDKIKQTKQEKYGDPNFNNIEKQQKTLMEVYGVSNAAALPHNIERAKKQLEEIRVRAYETGRYINPSDKPAYIRYRDEVRKLTERNIKHYKSKIKNIEKRSRKWHIDHKYSIYEGFVNNVAPYIIAHICNLEIVHSTLNESKNIKSSITLIELIQSIKEQDRRELLTCGGAAGHMAHPWDDHGLTFNDVREIVSRALEGRLDIESAVTEKTDGQNIMVTWKNGEPGFARNKGTVINPMTTAEFISEFESKYQKAVETNGVDAAAGYKLVVDAFRTCAEDLTAALNKVSPDRLNQIFKNGRVFANMEIIYPATRNVIAYEKAHLQFHNLVEFDERGNTIETDLTGGALMQSIISDANAHMQKTFSFIPPQRIKLGRVYDFEDQQAAFFNEIDQLERKFNLKDTDLLSDYHKEWWRDVISTQAKRLNYNIPSDILTTLIYRWAFFDKSTNISALKKQIDNPEFSQWVTEFDKSDFKKYHKQNLEPFESIFLRLGVLVLQNATNFLAANPSKAVQQIKTELADLIRDLQKTNNQATLDKLKLELKRIERLGGFDAIVPAEGIVFTYRGNTYKLTGAFAPVNQILGVLKYAR